MKPYRSILFALAVVLLTACGPQATATPVIQGDNNSYAPQAGDGALMYGDITIDSASILLAESQPLQVMVNFTYFLPTPCHQVRVETSAPDADNHIVIKAYALAEKDKACALMALATPLQANLNLGSFPAGHYFILLNGNQIGEFDT